MQTNMYNYTNLKSIYIYCSMYINSTKEIKDEDCNSYTTYT